MAWARLFCKGSPTLGHFEFLVLPMRSLTYVPLQDLKETSRLKSGFIHATKGNWEQVPILQDQLLESQEKLLKAMGQLTAVEEKQKKVAELAEAWKTLSGLNGKLHQADEDARTAKEAVGKAQEEAA